MERFAAIYFNPKATQDKLYAALRPSWTATRRRKTRSSRRSSARQLNDYVRLYAFLSQVITFTDADLEKLYVFARLLLRRLPVKRDELPVEIQKNIDMDSYRIKQTASGKIKLDRGVGELEPIRRAATAAEPPGRHRDHCRRSSRS